MHAMQRTNICTDFSYIWFNLHVTHTCTMFNILAWREFYLKKIQFKYFFSLDLFCYSNRLLVWRRFNSNLRLICIIRNSIERIARSLGKIFSIAFSSFYNLQLAIIRQFYFVSVVFFSSSSFLIELNFF